MKRWLIGVVVLAILVGGSVAGARARSGMNAVGDHTSILGQTAEQAGDDSNNIGGLIVFTIFGAAWIGGGALLVRSARRAKRQSEARAATAAAVSPLASSETDRPLPA
jgi:hypothetical protein